MLFRFLCGAGCFALALLAAVQATGAGTLMVNARALGLAAEQSEVGIPLLVASHAANPRDTFINLELGLELERAGNFDRAEKVLLEAARYDHQYQPAWTLANYYFRQNEPDQFWQWAHCAAELSYDDGRPLLRLATALEDNPSVVMDRLGRRPVLLRTYLDILIGQNREEAALQVAAMLADFHDPADAARFEAVSKRYGRTK